MGDGSQASVIGFVSPRFHEGETTPRDGDKQDGGGLQTPRSATSTSLSARASGGLSTGRTSHRTPRGVLKPPRLREDSGRAEDNEGGKDAQGQVARGADARDAGEQGDTCSDGGVLVNRATPVAEGEAEGLGPGRPSESSSGGPLDWLTRAKMASGKSPIKVFESWQNETLELREEVSRMAGLLEESSVQAKLDQRFHQASLDKERMSWAREQEEVVQRYSEALKALSQERDALRAQHEAEKAKRLADAAAWKKMLALVELETKKQVEVAHEALESQKQCAQEAQDRVESLLKTEADLRVALQRSDSERALLQQGADRDKVELIKQREQERAQEHKAKEDEVQAWKTKHASDTQMLLQERGALETNLCDEIARHVVTNGHLDKANEVCKGLKEEVRWPLPHIEPSTQP